MGFQMPSLRSGEQLGRPEAEGVRHDYDQGHGRIGFSALNSADGARFISRSLSKLALGPLPLHAELGDHCS